jgi:endonuclease YncB( thermonuclease family)
LEGDVDIYTIIFLALAVFILLRLPSILGPLTGSERPPVTDVASAAKWYSALEAAVSPVAAPTASASVSDSVPIYPANNGSSARIDVLLGVQPLRMLLDTGATLCMISEAIAARIVHDGYGVWQAYDGNFTMADGTTRTVPILVIREVRIGRHTIRNVYVGVSSAEEMLLAFHVVNDIAPFTIDTRAGLLIFHTSSNSLGGGHKVLGQRTGSERRPVTDTFLIRLSMIAAVLCAVLYVAYEAKWYAAIEARVTPITTISGLARVVDGDTVVVLLAMALLMGAALVLSFLHWKELKAQKPERGGGAVYLKKVKPLDGLLHGHPSQRKADDPGLLHQNAHQRRRIPVTGILIPLTAAVLGAVYFDVGSAKWYPSTTTAAATISGLARVIDGDTVVVAGTRVRLKGVDAAELGTARGENARRVMAMLVTGSLTCRLTGEKTYSREVGYCTTANGTDINRAIIAQGAALACPRYDDRYVQFEQAEALAAQPRASYCVRR